MLPPLYRSAPRLSAGERLFAVLLVVGLHLALLGAVLYLPVDNEAIALPSSISVRLLPMLPEHPPERQSAPPPVRIRPAPSPVRQKQVAPTPMPTLPPPVLASTSPSANPTFAVASSPPGPSAPTLPAPPAAFVEAHVDAGYLLNPKPVYPPISRRYGEEGKVLLKVRVSARGEAMAVSVARSSGYERLDAAASQAVAGWRFVAARRGDEAIESAVIVPVTFALE